ncbi:MAG: HAMP domain-containing sensor histidine kinase [Oscillospiraceae bacterium]
MAHFGGDYLEQTLEAMDKISQGDFSVLIEVDEHDPFSEITKSVNRIATELGSMENLRQDFVSNVSHEIQSPLTSIKGFAALLKSDNLTAEQRAHYIDVIESEAKRLSQLSDNLLKLSTLESNVAPLSPSKFPLDRQIRNSVLMLEPQWAEKHLNMTLSMDKIVISADEALLNQVWINLLQNAIKFTPESGEISVSLTEQDGFAQVKITDTGIGISEESLPHIFERFYKADKSHTRAAGGNGLGLSIVKKIITLHDGKITVKSELGAGTEFVITLPK